MVDSSQEFIAHNRTRRVQIDYDVELHGAEKKVQLRFVTGVMNALTGKSNVKPRGVEDRKFLAIDVDNFDSGMKARAPRVAFQMANTLTGEGKLPADLIFEKMDDFNPAAIAAKIEPLAGLLEAPTQLSNLMAYMDGKAGTADLASVEYLAGTGLVLLLTGEPMDEGNGRGTYSTLVWLYKFEETPPHAELLGRLARVAANVDAPVISAAKPSYLDVKIEDRYPRVAQAWDTLYAMPEAEYLGHASPQFLLRRPYGPKSEPIYEFEFEEFTMSEGLSGMLWANPAVLVTILLARSFKENSLSMQLGKIMSLGNIPFYVFKDRYGDQLASPCAERNLTMDKHEHSVQRRYMPVLSIKGRNEIRLGSFNAVSRREILGPWSDALAPLPSPAKLTPAPAPASCSDDDDDADLNLDDLLADFADDTDYPVASGDGGGDDMEDAPAAFLADL